MGKEIYTGTEQWRDEGEGRCEYCRRQSYCSKPVEGGCTARRHRLIKEDIKHQVETLLKSGVAPEALGLTPEIIERYDIEIPEAETFTSEESDIEED